MYPYGLIGNALCSALVSDKGSMDWMCFPRPDSEPVFGRLLDPDGGHFSIEPAGPYRSSQHYIPNTNILATHFECEDGSSFRVLDFAPRFVQYGRIYRPLSFFRIVEPVSGQSMLRVIMKPVQGWNRRAMEQSRGNSHLRFTRGSDYMRLATNMSLTYLCGEEPVGLREPLYFALTWNAGFEEDLEATIRDFERRTRGYWQNWVKHCDVPTRWQAETIRSALTLKLHCYEDTGAILAALSTSLPETHGEPRNWDYRFCWLRDAYFCVNAFHKLGHFEEMEGFIQFILDLAQRETETLRPVYRLDLGSPLPELEHLNWKGYEGSQPVRSGNQAAEHVQNDVYGELILTLTPLFLDERFSAMRHPGHEELLSRLARRCAETLGQPDAGLWELREGWRPHSFTHLMQWAGLERIRRLRASSKLPLPDLDLEGMLGDARKLIAANVIDGVLRTALKDDHLDASLLLAPVLGYPDAELNRATVEAIRKGLKTGDGPEGFLYRYLHKDDFGKPGSAFVICSFWLVQALAKLGMMDEARAAMDVAVKAANPLGLLSEHFDPVTRRQLGNFPQAYSHVGLINAAFAVSEPWDTVL